jgi:hypothetical protein
LLALASALAFALPLYLFFVSGEANRQLCQNIHITGTPASTLIFCPLGSSM